MLEENLSSYGTQTSEGAFNVRDLRKIPGLTSNLDGTKTAQISWQLPAGETIGHHEVGLYKKDTSGGAYARIQQDLTVTGAATGVSLTFEWDGVTDSDDYPRFALLVKSFKGTSVSYIIIEDIIKFD